MDTERKWDLLLDAAQSVGQFPVNLRDMGVDFYSCTGHKWLLGGWGTGMLYVKDEWIDKLVKVAEKEAKAQ